MLKEIKGNFEVLLLTKCTDLGIVAGTPGKHLDGIEEPN
jgi:hypothetical protein